MNHETERIVGISSGVSRYTEYLFRYRWAVGVVLLLIAIIFELSGSSIGMWSTYLSDASITDDGVLLGNNRPIRSDEWAVSTPLVLSQYHNHFRLTNNLIRAAPTDVATGNPIRDWTIIFRPFQIGYLFLSPGKGMAFWWFGMFIALLLVSFEFGLFITGGKKGLSLAYAILLAFAPAVQWWFSTGLQPILIYGQGLVLLAHAYLSVHSYKKRLLYALGGYILGEAYLLTLYPAWQIPFFYIFLAILIGMIVQSHKSFSFDFKKDVPILMGLVLLIGATTAFVLYRSWDSIQALANSVYPGARMETGGKGSIAVLFRYVGNMFLPYVDKNVPSNHCEISVFFDMFPLGFLLSASALRQKGKDGLTISLFCVTLALGFYVVIGFPKALSKVSLFYTSQVGRTLVASSYANVLLLIRGLAVLDWKVSPEKKRMAQYACVILAVLTAWCSCRLQYSSYFTNRMLWIAMLVLAILFLTAVSGEKWFCLVVCAFSISIGATVNPLRSGVDILQNNSLSQGVREQLREDGGSWISASTSWVISNLLTMNGAPTVNSTNRYVNWDFWRVIDPDGAQQEIYNRYAHISIDLTASEPNQIKLTQADSVYLKLNISYLHALGIEYVVTPANLDGMQTHGVSLHQIWSSPNVKQKIYQVVYDESAEPFILTASPILYTKEQIAELFTHNASVSVDGDSMTITATEFDPFVYGLEKHADVQGALSEATEIIISFDYTSSVSGNFQIYYTNAQERDFSEKKSVRHSVGQSGSVWLRIPCDTSTMLRFDIPDGAEFSIRNLKIQGVMKP